MFIIPVGNRVDWKRPPVITLLLIVVNCLVFFLFQSGDQQQEMRAAQYYMTTDLPKWELPRYADYLQQDVSENAGERRQMVQTGGIDALMAMESDGQFMHALHTGQIITPRVPEYAKWRAERQQYESRRSFTEHHVYRVDEPSALDAFTAAFLHGGYGHLFGNMLVLFLVGFLVESVVGKMLFALAYFASIFASVAVFTLTAHHESLLGASGAIAGIMGLYTVIFGLRKIDFFYSLAFYFNYIRAPAILLLPLWLGNEFYQFASEKGSHVAHMAHFGGLLCGATIGGLYRLRRSEQIESRHEEAESQDMDKEAFQRGMKLLGAMEFKKALAIFKPLLEKHPDDVNLTRLVYRAAKAEPASEDYHRAALRLMSLPGTDAAANVEAHKIFHEYLERAQPRPRLGPDLVAHLAKRFAASGHCEDADRLVTLLRRSAPQHGQLPAALLALARGYFRAQQRNKYMETLNLLIGQFPQSGEAEAAKTMLRAS